MRYLILLILVGLGLYAVVFNARPAGTKDAEFYEAVKVEKGVVVFVLRESGTLSPREAVLVKSKLQGNLKWVIEDGSWIKKGETVFIVGEDEELRRVTEMRTQLLNARQELKLAQMKRAHAAAVERRKLQAAQRAYELEKIRDRILNSNPKGGKELIRLHELLVPLEKETSSIRDAYEEAQFKYQDAQDEYLDALDAWQAQRDKILQVQAKIDEYSVDKNKDPDKLDTKALKRYEENQKKLVEAEKKMEDLRAKMPELSRKVRQAATVRDKAKQPRNQVYDRLRRREAKEKELYIELEIEKRGVELTSLQYDRQSARLSLAEAQRQLKNARQAFQVGSVSQSSVESLEAKVRTEESKLRIIEQKIKIAERPPEPEVLAEARMKLEKARAAAENAQDAHDRALKILDTEIAMLEAKVRKLEADIDQHSRNFPTLIESNIAFAQKERELLDDDEVQRKEQIQVELQRLEKQLVAARESPPNIAKAPVSGVVQLRNYGRRLIQIGNSVAEEDAIAMIYPPKNMEVTARINEVNLRYIRRGMNVRISIPALDHLQCRGDIYAIAGVGKDKLDEFSRWFNKATANVTQFETHIQLEKTFPEFRQGMTVMIAIDIDRRQDALWVPAAAVEKARGKFFVLTDIGDKKLPKEVKGEFFGDDAFIISEGLHVGDLAYIQRRKNR